MEITVHDLHEIQEAVKKIRSAFPDNRVWLLYGEMGSGKTTLIKEFCRQLDVSDETSSPTFSIVNEYRTKSGKKIFHADLYRIKTLLEAMETGIGDMLNSGNHFFIEWPEILEARLLPSHVMITLRHEADASRTLHVAVHG